MRDSGFGQNTVRESGKCKMYSRDPGFMFACLLGMPERRRSK